MKRNSKKYKAAVVKTLKKREKQRKEEKKRMERIMRNQKKQAVVTSKPKPTEAKPEPKPKQRRPDRQRTPKHDVYFQLIYRHKGGVLCEFAGKYLPDDDMPLPRLPDYIITHYL